MVLVVLGDVAVDIIHTVLGENTENGYCSLWPADTYDNLPDYAGRAAKGTTAPIDENWHSPFTSLHEALEFVRNISKTPKPPCKVFCAVLDRERHRQHGQVLSAKVDEREPQVIPCRYGRVGIVFEGMDRDVSPDRLELWEEEEICM